MKHDRQAHVFNNGILAGTLMRRDNTFVFRYDDRYLIDTSQYPISVSLPKTRQEHRSATLFPFFCGLLAEGVNRQLQCRLLRVDEYDRFGLLLATAGADTIGAITLKAVDP